MARKTKNVDFLAAAKASTTPVPITGHGVKGWNLCAKPLSAKAMQVVMDNCRLPGKTAADGEASIDTTKFGLALIVASIVTDKGAQVFRVGQESEMADDLPQLTYAALQKASLTVNGMIADDSGN